MTATIMIHNATQPYAQRAATPDGVDCSSLHFPVTGGGYACVFMPFDVAEAMASAYAAAQTPGYQAMLAFVEEVRDCRPDVISGRRRDPQDDQDDMIAADVLWTLQADAEKLIGKRQKTVAA